jgi:hypothetical protein
MTTSTTDIAAALHAVLEQLEGKPAATPETDKYTVTGENIELPAAITKPLLKEFKDAEKEYKDAKQRFEDAKSAIGDAMEYHEVMVVEETGQIVAEYRVTTAMVLDTAKLKKEEPQVAAKYQRERHSRSVRVLV